MGYRWIRLDLRITPGWGEIRISGFRIRKSGKTGKWGKSHVTYHFKALGKPVNVGISNFRISWFWTRKIRKSRKSGETGKFRKIQKFACDLSNESSWQAGSRGHNKIPEFRKIPGKLWKNVEKMLDVKNVMLEIHTYFCRPKGDHTRVLNICFLWLG